ARGQVAGFRMECDRNRRSRHATDSFRIRESSGRANKAFNDPRAYGEGQRRFVHGASDSLAWRRSEARRCRARESGASTENLAESRAAQKRRIPCLKPRELHSAKPSHAWEKRILKSSRSMPTFPNPHAP